MASFFFLQHELHVFSVLCEEFSVCLTLRSFLRNFCKKKGTCNPFGRGKLEGTYTGRIKSEDELFLHVQS